MSDPAMSKVCLVTGASRGIGAAIADLLGAQGHIVIGTATTDEGAARIAERFSSNNVRGTGHRLDVNSAADVEALLTQVGDAFGAPLVLVNNAGITRDNLLMRMKDAEWESVIATNLGAVYRLSKAVLRAMTKARWGRIVSISSVVGSMGNAGQSNYAASKAGMEGFTRALAREIGSRGITVNCVAPGFIDTDMTRALSEAQSLKMLEQIPAGRFGNAAEVAATVAFLVSDGAAYITGETIHVNGGMYMR
jgi:3-oxoacyl-[acyl-carrier protein] reductase